MGVGSQLVKVGERLGLLEKRADPILSIDQILQMFSFSGTQYAVPFLGSQTLGQKQEWPSGSFESYIQGIYKTNGVVFACMAVRMLLFSEARFQFRQMTNGRPGDLFGTAELDILEHPWPNATTGDLLSRVIQDADIAGNHYSARRGNQIFRMRPNWVTIVLGSKDLPETPALAMDAKVLGYLYQPGGGMPTDQAVFLTPEQVAHFAPIPDPAFLARGMSWLTPVLPEIMGDSAATTHKLKFFEQGATPNLVVTMGDMSEEQFKLWVKLMSEQHEGLVNAYKTLWLANGAQPQVIGSNFRQIDFKATQGAGETRIAAAAGVPPIIAGLSEGLAAGQYNIYAQARRRFADGTMRPLWRNVAGSFQTLVNVPGGADLWYDDRDIPFLKEDLKDSVDIQQVEATSVRTLIDAGFYPQTAVDAVKARDFSKLKHSGLFSVQLQPPGSDRPKMEQYEAVGVKTLIDAGFTPESVVAAVAQGDFTKLVFKEKPPSPIPPQLLPPAPPAPVPPTNPQGGK